MENTDTGYRKITHWRDEQPCAVVPTVQTTDLELTYLSVLAHGTGHRKGRLHCFNWIQIQGQQNRKLPSTAIHRTDSGGLLHCFNLIGYGLRTTYFELCTEIDGTDFCIVFPKTNYGHEMSKFVQRSIEKIQDDFCVVLTWYRLRTTNFEVSTEIRITFTLFLLFLLDNKFRSVYSD